MSNSTANTPSGPGRNGHKMPLELSKIAPARTDTAIRQQAVEYLKDSMLVERIVEDIHTLGVIGEDDLVFSLYLIGTSRLLDRPLAALVTGASSEGKSFVIRNVRRLFPKEAVLRAHTITPRSLLYLPQGDLVHRFVVAGERSRRTDEDAAEGTKLLREMLGDGDLAAIVTMRKGQSFETQHITQDGPIAYVENTTMSPSRIFEEDRNRLLLLATDDSQEQTCAVLMGTAQKACAPRPSSEVAGIIQLHHAAQRLLQPAQVRIPFAKELAEEFPSGLSHARRAFPQLLACIRAAALLHQYQRERESSHIIATPTDYELVRSRIGRFIERSLWAGLSGMAPTVLARVRKMTGDITASTVTSALNVAGVQACENTVRVAVKNLVAVGKLRVLTEARGPHAATYALREDGQDGDSILPGLSEGWGAVPDGGRKGEDADIR